MLAAALILGLKLLKPVPVPALAGGTVAAGAMGAAAGAAEIPSTPPTISMQLRSAVQSESSDNPGAVAQVMRAWMTES